MSDNGNVVDLNKFASAKNVGDPFTTHTSFVTVMGTCNCDLNERVPLLIVGLATIVQCPKCKKGYQLLLYSHDITKQKVPTLGINITLPDMGKSIIE